MPRYLVPWAPMAKITASKPAARRTGTLRGALSPTATWPRYVTRGSVRILLNCLRRPPFILYLLRKIPYSASPPGLMSRLRRRTRHPAAASARVAKSPAGPAPTTATACVVDSGMGGDHSTGLREPRTAGTGQFASPDQLRSRLTGGPFGSKSHVLGRLQTLNVHTGTPRVAGPLRAWWFELRAEPRGEG